MSAPDSRSYAETPEEKKQSKRDIDRQRYLENRDKIIRRSRKYFAANREKAREVNKLYRLKHLERIRQYDRDRYPAKKQKNKEWRDKNRERAQYLWRDSRLRKKYGITMRDFEKKLKRQKGKCVICKCSDPGAQGWHVDHCHKSGKVRAILCGYCNLLLGYSREDIAVLKNAIKFIRRHSRPIASSGAV